MAERMDDKGRYIAVIDQEKVNQEVRDIATKYDPLNRSGRGEGFHVTDGGELHIDQEEVMEEHRIIENKIPNEAIRILRLPTETGQLIHRYGENSFRLYELPTPVKGRVVGLLGRNGTGKSTALKILAGMIKPNLGDYDGEKTWDEIIGEFRGKEIQNHLEALKDGEIEAAYKPQHVDSIPEKHSGRVRQMLEENDETGRMDELVDDLGLEEILERELEELSGGELQRAAIAATLLKDADLYLVDEPSSYLDVGQRLNLARVLREAAEDGRVLVVEHDLATLDLLSDNVHILYGDPGGFGVVSHPLSVKKGINRFLEGKLPKEDLQFREESIDFHTRKERSVEAADEVMEFPRLEKSFDSFHLETEAGEIHEQEVLGIFGRNALGKTTFARMLAGALEPDEGEVPENASISYKPQYIETGFDGTVRELLSREADIYSQRFKTRVKKPFDLEQLYESGVQDLSGGELQRVGIALALSRDADLYLLDEPSAYLDVDRRVSLAKQIRSFVENEETSCLLIDHDLLLLDYVSDRAMVFQGTPGKEGVGNSPESEEKGLNRFLSDMGITFRTDPETGRPRANKPGSQKDREQKEAGEYYA
ncbi:MAG: ribosome biogenesis/translation initiation ATPase RLI [Candidatus Nanohaloarchaea archaeon]|nr:ribosome biogenesis/translation initiation ATPase RLI [Candidatus Nanohaloarchaea archaeon]